MMGWVATRHTARIPAGCPAGKAGWREAVRLSRCGAVLMCARPIRWLVTRCLLTRLGAWRRTGCLAGKAGWCEAIHLSRCGAVLMCAGSVRWHSTWQFGREGTWCCRCLELNTGDGNWWNNDGIKKSLQGWHIAKCLLIKPLYSVRLRSNLVQCSCGVCHCREAACADSRCLRYCSNVEPDEAHFAFAPVEIFQIKL